jgi:WD40 repeat protein
LRDFYLASGSKDLTIKIWNINTEECLETLRGHSGSIWDLQILSCNELVSCSDDATIKFWDMKTQKCVRTLNENALFGVTCHIRNFKKGELCSTHSDGTIKIWDLITGKCVKSINAHQQSIFGLSFLIN